MNSGLLLLAFAGLLLLLVLLALTGALSRQPGRKPLLAGCALLLLLVVALCYWAFGQHAGLAANLQARHSLAPLLSKMQQGGQLSSVELAQLSQGLRAQLDEKEDAEGWRLLGRLAFDQEQLDLAFGALARAYQLAPEQVGVRRDYARLLLMTQDSAQQQQGLSMLEQLAAQPNELEALSLLAFYQLEQGQPQQAAHYWQLMLQRLPDSDPRRALLQQTLEQLAEPAAGQQPEAQQADNGPPLDQPQPADNAVAGQLAIEVQLAAELADKVPAGARLLLFVKAVGGPPMPLAVRQQALGNWPVRLQLSDADAMLPELKLSQFEQIEVTARLTTSADVKAVAGDLQGQSGPLQRTNLSQPLQLTIDDVVNLD